MHAKLPCPPGESFTGDTCTLTPPSNNPPPNPTSHTPHPVPDFARLCTATSYTHLHVRSVEAVHAADLYTDTNT
jgi:hypothetical protein